MFGIYYFLNNKLSVRGKSIANISRNRKRINEPRHDKTNIVGLRPALIQTSLRNRAV
jgi:hypothetical protein